MKTNTSASRLREYRERRGLKQVGLTPRAGVSLATANKAERRRRKALRPVAGKKICAEFKFWHMRSRSGHFTRVEARVTKWERFGILVVLVLVVSHLVESWLAKH
jgi:DNA-binding XRE family transcriptional regulator